MSINNFSVTHEGIRYSFTLESLQSDCATFVCSSLYIYPQEKKESILHLNIFKNIIKYTLYQILNYEIKENIKLIFTYNKKYLFSTCTREVAESFNDKVIIPVKDAHRNQRNHSICIVELDKEYDENMDLEITVNDDKV